MRRKDDKGCSDDAADRKAGGPRRRVALVAIALVAVEAAALRRRAGRFGGRLIVRCREGHLFSTIWIPGASFKSLKLGLWRYQRCPVGDHWSLVTPVNPAELSEEDLALAQDRRDTPIP
jgi:hypothetical protein